MTQIEGEIRTVSPKRLAESEGLATQPRRTRISNHLVELPDVLISRAKCCNLFMSSKKIQLISIYFFCSLGLIILYYFDPAEAKNIYPPSLSREWGGFYCAGCGILRGLHQLLHGNWQSAMRFNPLLVIYLLYFFYRIILSFFRYFYQINLYTIQYKKEQIFLVAFVCLIYTILRNIPSPVLSWLVPPS